MTTLTEEQKKVLEKMEKIKLQNKLRQQRYREKNKDNEEYKKSRAEYQRNYRKQLKEKFNSIQGVVNKVEEKPKPVEIVEIMRPPIKSKREKRYDKKHNITNEVIPAFKTRKTGLEQSTIKNYIDKSNILHKFFTNNALPVKLRDELNKLFNDNQFADKYITTNMPYLNNAEDTIQKLREKYPKDNSFKNYVSVLAVIAGHITSLNKNYQMFSKVAKNVNEGIEKKRADNTLPKADEKKIIDINKNVVMSNLEKLKNIADKFIYSLYTLFPSRREEDYRLMKLTYYNRADELDTDYNYLQVMKDNTMNFIFNEYKTKKKFKQQIFDVPTEIVNIANSYINQMNIKENELLFFSNNDHKDLISQSNFSTRISTVFKKVHDIPVSVQFIRKSHSTYLFDISHKERWSANKIKDYTDKMAHSESESRLYRALKFE